MAFLCGFLLCLSIWGWMRVWALTNFVNSLSSEDEEAEDSEVPGDGLDQDPDTVTDGIDKPNGPIVNKIGFK